MVNAGNPSICHLLCSSIARIVINQFSIALASYKLLLPSHGLPSLFPRNTFLPLIAMLDLSHKDNFSPAEEGGKGPHYNPTRTYSVPLLYEHEKGHPAEAVY